MKKKEYLQEKYINFDLDNCFVYNLTTEKGFFNIGAGQLVVCENDQLYDGGC